MEDGRAPPKPGTGFRLHTAFIKSPSGIAFMVNIVLYFISTCAIGHVDNKYTLGYSGSVSFLLTISVITFLMYVVFFVLMLIGIIPHRFQTINWPLTFFIDSVVNSGLYFIASCVFAVRTSGYNNSTFETASAFGFIAMIGSMIQAALYFLEYRNASNLPPPIEQFD